MKILQINTVYGYGSTGVILKDIHELCAVNNIESFVAYSLSNLPDNEIKNGYKIGGAFGKKLHAAFCRINGMQGYFSRFSTWRFIRYIDKINPEIVQLHNLHSNYIHLNMLLKYLAKKDIKTIVTLHDCWFYTGGCFHYTTAGCDKWLESCGECPKNKRGAKALLFDRSSKILRDRKKYFGAIKNLTIVGVSKWITDEALKTVFKDKKAVAIHNGVDTDFFRPVDSDLRKRYGLENKFIILGPYGKWTSRYNREIFNSVVNSLKDDEVLVLVGCRDKNIISHEKVIVLPFVTDRNQLREIYSSADVFVNPTNEESLSLINVEAQSCGTPVITHLNTGVRETVDGICGFAVENGNTQAIIKQIALIKEKGKSYFTEDCRRWVKENFNRDENYNKYISLYYEV
ncbi:MAG: glycosyltransferase [Acutalibacteraceae bacterium]|nr:glycosyltransferase [Acutalibacteraceae bacterium]